jgi:hypothetical protein
MQVAFHPNAPLDEMCKRATCDLSAYRRALPPDAGVGWRAWAGAQLVTMMNSPDSTVRYLTNANTSLRLTAASLVAEYWSPDELFAAPCLRLAFGDPDAEVRGAALVCLLNGLHSFVDDPSGVLREILRFLRSVEPIAEALIHTLRTELNEGIEELHEQRIAELRQLAGEHLGEMCQSAATAVDYLRHPAENLRRAALLALYEYWRADFDVRSAAMQLIRNDDDLTVRLEAQNILSAVCYRTNDPEVRQFLAAMVRDSSEPMEIRKGAYLAMFMVRPMPVGRILQITSPDFRFPEEVDWAFVN